MKTKNLMWASVLVVSIFLCVTASAQEEAARLLFDAKSKTSYDLLKGEKNKISETLDFGEQIMAERKDFIKRNFQNADSIVSKTTKLAQDTDVVMDERSGKTLYNPLADHDKNGRVNAADYSYFLGDYGKDIYLFGDFNRDGKVDDTDLAIFSAAYNKGDENYNPLADYDKNGRVNAFDLSYFGLDYGKDIFLWSDFNRDGKVDNADFVIFKAAMGSRSDAPENEYRGDEDAFNQMQNVAAELARQAADKRFVNQRAGNGGSVKRPGFNAVSRWDSK